MEEQIAIEAMSSHLIGDPTTVAEGLSRLQTRTAADEIMISTRVHSLEARIKSLTLVASAWGISEAFEPLQ
jgi:alkanesulfonate monooxygenase SsuD/methylene tetrahydromethanopterin reductase-like flavin-dependent oxidoreductase (luciferase family)